MREQSIPVFYDIKSAASTQYANAIQGIRAAAARSGTRISLLPEEELERVDFEALPPVAIITSASMPYLQNVLQHLRAAGKRAVLAGTDSEQFGHDVSCATPSRRTETQQLVNYLYNCGRTSLALVGFGKNSINDTFRYHAAMSAVAAWGKLLTERDAFLWQHDPSACFDAFLEAAGRYDAVICPNDVMAICFITRCQQHGLRVPEDLYVASFGNMSIGRFFRPSITTMTMDMLLVGEQAFNVWRFVYNSDSSQETALKITVPSRILVRESTAMTRYEAGTGLVSPSLQADRFYHNPTIAALVGIEFCISQRDELDMRIIKALMDGHSYERIADDLFISGSTLRYRLNKVFGDTGVKTRLEFEQLVHTYLGKGNPFGFVK